MNLFKNIRQAFVNEKKEKLEEKIDAQTRTLERCVDAVKRLEETYSTTDDYATKIECRVNIEKIKISAFDVLTKLFENCDKLEELE